MSCFEKTIYPFTAIVGQEKMKKALLLNAINPRLGGVLIKGEKGTAKSTAVRALAALLPEIEVVADCIFGCHPTEPSLMCESCLKRFRNSEKMGVAKKRTRVINLPVSATEDRVVGTLDIEQAIKKGEKKFEPGVLAEAHRGILYVDEINLLDDHVVDILLDSAAMGTNIVEREGVSFSHPAHFILVGTMNPEEGDLRPQLLDRFGLCVSIEGITDPKSRVEIIKKRAAYEDSPVQFIEGNKEEQSELRETIVEAQAKLKEVTISDQMLELIANISLQMGVDGHRADIVMMKTAMTIAAYYGRTEVTEEDVKEAAELVLLHRMRRKPFQEPQMDQDKLNDIMDQQKQQNEQNNQNQQQEEKKKMMMK